MNKFERKNVLITGSSSGLGFFLSEHFVKDGHNIYLNGSTKNRLELAKKKLKSSGFLGDLRDEHVCKLLIKNCEKNIGNLDVVICNLGSGKSVATGVENLKEWKRVFDINFFSAVNTINAVKNFSKSKKISVICISSICGHEYISGAPVTYSVAKAALNNYVNIFSKHLEPRGINLNAILCGNIMFPGSSWESKIKNNKKKSDILRNVPTNRFATPKDIFNTIMLLSQKDSFISGSSIVVDGGQTASI